MSNVIKLITDYSIVFIFAAIFIYFIIRYGDKYLKITLSRMENKNYMIDTLTKSLENCTNVIAHNTKALENNSSVVKNYTDNAFKLEKKIEQLAINVKENDDISNKILTEVKILKDRK